MHSTNSLLPLLRRDYPQLNFQPSQGFAWSSSDQTVYYVDGEDPAYLLHELAHATLSHSTYSRDIELLRMERSAWDETASNLATTYNLTISDDLVQDSLDTYREWLHARSLCPDCASVGYQIKRSLYKCAVCETEWQVNEARTCGLRRYKIQT